MKDENTTCILCGQPAKEKETKETEHHDDRGVLRCSLYVWKRIN